MGTAPTSANFFKPEINDPKPDESKVCILERSTTTCEGRRLASRDTVRANRRALETSKFAPTVIEFVEACDGPRRTGNASVFFIVV
jgi:hypothetical protein